MADIVEKSQGTNPDQRQDSEVTPRTEISENDFNNILKCIFTNENDYQNYAKVMKEVGEFDYGIGFKDEKINLRLRLNFSRNIRGTTIVIRPLLHNIPNYKKLTSLEWAYSDSKNKFLTEEISNQLKKMSHV